MINEPTLYITVTLSALAGLSIITAAGLTGWREWIALRRQELLSQAAHRPTEPTERSVPSVASRIEVADLKERIRKLEAIAAGVDL